MSRGRGCASCKGSGFNLGVSPSQNLQGSCGAQVTPGLRQVPTLQWELSGGDGIPLELFQILKDDAVKVLHSTCQQIWKTQHWPQDWKRSVFIPIPKKGSAKECLNYCTIALTAKDRETLYIQQKQDQELTVAHELLIAKFRLKLKKSRVNH